MISFRTTHEITPPKLLVRFFTQNDRATPENPPSFFQMSLQFYPKIDAFFSKFLANLPYNTGRLFFAHMRYSTKKSAFSAR